MESDRKFLSLTEVGERLGVSVQTVGRIVERGELPAVKIGRRQKVPATAVSEYLERRKVPATA
jgi:excisionase family DNA binding protein